MAYSFRIYRPSNTIQDYDAKHLKAVRAAIANAKELLETSLPADSFAGRRTQEPFPQRERPVSRLDLPTK
jgi:hypothetical protein